MMKSRLFHPLSAIVLIVLDGLFGFPEIILPFSIPIALALAFTACTISVTLIQHNLEDDPWGAAFAKGFALGILAGVPYPVVGTAAGTMILIWSGLKRRALED